jgi:hypothetical protein
MTNMDGKKEAALGRGDKKHSTLYGPHEDDNITVNNNMIAFLWI